MKAKFELAKMEEGMRLMRRTKGLVEEKVCRILWKRLSKKLRIWGSLITRRKKRTRI